MKRGTPRHPKVYDLVQALGLPVRSRVIIIGYLELLWHFTSEFAPQGDIGKYSDSRIEGAMDWNGARGKLVEALTNTGWCDKSSQHRLLVHDWHDHADDSVKKRLIRAGLDFLTVTGEVTGQRPQPSRTTADNGGLPKPLPEPIPEPVPEAGRSLSLLKPPRYEDTASEQDISIRETSSRMYGLHSKKKNLPLVVPALADAVARAPDWRTAIADIEACHAAWCAHSEWLGNNGKFVPKLPDWISDQGYTRWPPGHARNQPARKPNIYNPPTMPTEESDDPRTSPVQH